MTDDPLALTKISAWPSLDRTATHGTEIAVCIREQQQAAARIRALGPAAGAWEWLYLEDWLLEECLIRMEACA